MEARLIDRDWRFITDSLYYIYGAKTLGDFENEVLQRFQVIIPCNHCMFTIIHESDDAPTTYSDIAQVGEPARYLDQFLARNYDHDPYFQSWNYFKSTTVFRDTDMMPDEYREATPLYREIYAKQGIHFAMRTYIVHEGHTIGNVALFRTKDDEDFSDRELEVARVLAPHITQKLVMLQGDAEARPRIAAAPAIPTRYSLTPKELEVVTLILEELDDAQIAEQLSISRATLKTHIYNIYRKTNVKNRLQLVLAMRGK